MSPTPPPSRQSSRQRRAEDAIIEFPNSHARALTEAIQAHTAALAVTNKNLEIIAECASETLGFFRKVVKKWVPIIIVAASVLWPSVGKIVEVVGKASGVP